ncbi:MAG: ATP-binding protein, partial [Myxococcota bacterium]|nr:ATP-binding protein [Myxococcota bacterium]
RYVDVVRQPLGSAPAQTMLVAVRDETRNTLHRSNLQFVDRMTALGTLTAGVAHEVNNALHSVLGQVEISKLQLERGDLGRMQRSLSLIDKGGQRISDVVRRLQRFSATTDTAPGPIDVGAVVESTVTLARHRIRHAAELRMELQEGLPLVTGVESHVAQVVMNLVLNAADAAEDTDQACILVEALPISGGAGVELRVSDSGPGVPTEVADRIFQPFYSTKQTGKGSGLGLAISASITAQMGATLTLESGSLRGACFVLRIPAATELGARQGSRPEQPLSASDLILIVDDEPDVAEVMIELLEPARVQCVRSAEEARRVWSDDFSWVISDVVMARESGLSLRQWFVDHHPDAIDRFLLMTGNAVHLEDEVARLPSTQVILHKPLGRQELLRQIAKAKRRRRT